MNKDCPLGCAYEEGRPERRKRKRPWFRWSIEYWLTKQQLIDIWISFADSVITWRRIMSKPLTKSVIVESVNNRLGLPKKECAEMFETLLEIIKSTLASGEDVLISRFGKFEVKSKKARRGRNPHTGENLMLVPRRVVKFRCSGKLRDKVNGG